MNRFQIIIVSIICFLIIKQNNLVKKNIITKFKSLKNSSKLEWDYITDKYENNVNNKIYSRLIDLIKTQRGDDKKFGLPIDLYEHQLQAATRAFRDNADNEIVIISLFHDATVFLAPYNHGNTIAEILYPYLSEKAYWILSHHDLFQSFYYLHHSGQDSEKLRKQFKNEKYYNDTVYFCENYDQNSFDNTYDTFNLDFFKLLIDDFFKKQPFWWNNGINPKT